MQFHSEVKLFLVLQINYSLDKHLLSTYDRQILWRIAHIVFIMWKLLHYYYDSFWSSLVQTRFPFIQWCLYFFYTQTIYKTYLIFLIWKTKIETSFFMKTYSPHSLNSLVTLTIQIFGLVICLLTRMRLSLHWKMAKGVEIFKKRVPQEWRDKEAEKEEF